MKNLYYRLIALWVICEAMLGGIIHGFKIPVSGLVVGSCAIVCITLIAWYVPSKGAILKATIIVAIFKMMLSPHSPPPAYVAVFFQGMLAELLFWNRRFFTACCILFAVLALLESGLQRILMLTIVYGNDFWIALNRFISNLTEKKEVTNYSFFIAAAYAMLHVCMGLVVGWWCARLPRQIRKWSSNSDFVLTTDSPMSEVIISSTRKRRKTKWLLLIIWLLLISLYVQSYFEIGKPILPSHISLKILLRSLIIVLGWTFIIGPVLTQLLHNWLLKKRAASQETVQAILQLLPSTRFMVTESWKKAGTKTGVSRIVAWGKIVLVNSLNPGSNKPYRYILTAKVQSGKTSSIIEWLKYQHPGSVTGILTPVIDGTRVFRNIASGEQFQMDAFGDEPVLEVGRFRFSMENFHRAKNIIEQSIKSNDLLIIDEIGPLELRGEGFCESLEKIVAAQRNDVLLVVRDKDDTLVEVIKKFGLHNYKVIKSMDEMPGSFQFIAAGKEK